MSRRGVVGAAVLVAAVVAQGPDELQQQLERARGDLQQVRGEAASLLDARIRHDLGLPVERDLSAMRGDIPVASTSTAMDRARQQLTTEETATAGLVGRYEKLRQQVEQLRQEAALRAQQQQSDEEWITIPAPGSTWTPPKPVAAEPPATTPFATRPPVSSGGVDGVAGPVGGERGAAPAGEIAPVRVVANLPPIKAQIDGSDDRGRVALSLFRAGQALIDRADQLQSLGQVSAARELYDQAQQRLGRAVEELQPATAGKAPEFADLFHLGKCRELLFRIAEHRDGLSPESDAREYQRREQEVRDPMVAITAGDVIVSGGVEQLGPWGRAAQAAMDHFRWMNLHAGYRPKVDLDAITWPGQKQN